MNTLTDALKLFEDNESFAYYCLGRVTFGDFSDEDLKQCALLGLWKASLGFDASKGNTFATYAFAVCRNEILMQIRRNKHWKQVESQVSLDSPIPLTDDDNTLKTIGELVEDESIPDMCTMQNLDDFLKTLDSREQDIVYLSFLGLTQEEIAEYINHSQSYTSRLLKKIREKWVAYND